MSRRFPRSWVAALERRAVQGQAVNETPETLARIDVEPAERLRFPNLPAAATVLLDELYRANWFARTIERKCPICGVVLPELAPTDDCPNTDSERGPHAFTDDGDDGPIEVRSYSRSGIRRRAVGWLVALHGMNTRGDWQEAFSWRVSTSYGRMVPVAIYKYGVVRPGVLFRQRQRSLMDGLVRRIRRAAREVAKIVDDPKPDVIAHSFGTFLLGHALHRDSSLRVGRVITLGCILRPDFDWATLVERGQVEAVLNHYGTRDFWARAAHYAIPDSGPAGRRGFDFYEQGWPKPMRASGARRLFNVPAEGLGHSDFFRDPESGSTLERLFAEVWEPFLTTKDVRDLEGLLPAKWPDDRWRPARWPRRALMGGWRKAPHTVVASRGSELDR